MVDYFNTNWTQQMKMNPVANMILNGKPQPDTEYLEFRNVRRLKKKGPLTLEDLFKNSSSISRKYDEKYIEDVVGGDDWKEMADEMKATPVDEFIERENKKAHRIAKSRDKAKAKQDARALQKRRKQRQQRHRKQGQIEQQQQGGIEIDITALDQQGQFENIRQDNDRMVHDMMVAQNKQTGATVPLIGDEAKEQGDRTVTTNMVAIDIDGIDDDRREQRPRRRVRHLDPGYDSDNLSVDDEKGDGNLENIDMGYGSSDDDYIDIKGGINLGFVGDYHGESGMWDNTYVKDYINIHHPKLLPDYYIQALKQQPLQIKPPSVFFSDI